MPRLLALVATGLALVGWSAAVLASTPAHSPGRAHVIWSVLAQQQPQQQQPAQGAPPERPGKPRWKGHRLKGHEKPVTQTILTMFALIGVLYTIARTARRAYGD